jgi:hypothetical protein
MNELDQQTPEAEHRHHHYVGYHIPWYVHVLWITFWAFAIYYTLRYLLPAIRTEWLAPP